MDNKRLEEWFNRCAYSDRCVLYHNKDHDCVNTGKDCKVHAIYHFALSKPYIPIPRECPPLTIEHKIEGGDDGNAGREK